MAKKYRSKKRNEQFYNRIFYAMLAMAAVIVIALVVIAVWPQNNGYSLTADGHVHDAAGNHVGDINDLLANGELTVTEDGHIHDAAGNHIGDVMPTEVTDDAQTTDGTEAAEDVDTPAAE